VPVNIGAKRSASGFSARKQQNPNRFVLLLLLGHKINILM